MSGQRACVLEHDPELEELVPPAQRRAARRASYAAVIDVGTGQWDARADGERARQGYGLLMLDGLLLRRCGFEGRFGAELLSAGDLLRPWEYSHDGASIDFETTWRVLARARLAVLDAAWAQRMAAFPRIGPALTGRALWRSRRLSSLMVIAQNPRLDERLWLLFWELADRHGRVHPDGVHVDLPLTHEILSDLAAARRPSVSGALTRLAAAGRVRRERRGWVLAGEPPEPAS